MEDMYSVKCGQS